jgi:hypothetical protein
MSAETADWLSPAKAFTLVADAYKAIQPDDAEIALEWARNAVISALAKGHCKARAVEASLDLGGVHAALVFALTKSPVPFAALDANNQVSAALWQNFQLCGQFDTQDWERGNLQFTGVQPILKQPIRGRAVGVELERESLPLIGSGSAYAATSAQDQGETVEPKTEEDLRTWIKRQPRMSGDAAFDLYKLEPQKFVVKRDEFRKIWKQEQGTKRGRPAG